MKKFLYSALSLILIIIFLIQGKIILGAKRENEKSALAVVNEEVCKPLERKEESSISINSIMELLYSKNRQYTVNNLSFKQEGRILEVEVSYYGTISHMREEFKDIMSFTGFKEVKSYQEDDQGLKKLCLSFVLEK